MQVCSRRDQTMFAMFLEWITDSGGVTLYIEIFYIAIIKNICFCATHPGSGTHKSYFSSMVWIFWSQCLWHICLFPEGSNYVWNVFGMNYWLRRSHTILRNIPAYHYKILYVLCDPAGVGGIQPYYSSIVWLLWSQWLNRYEFVPGWIFQS